MKTAILTAILAIVALPLTISAQTAAEIITKHTTDAATELESYLASLPDAPDKLEAYDFLIDAYTRLEQPDKQAGYIRKKYDVIPKGAALDPQQFFDVFQSMFSFYIRKDDTDNARATLIQGKLDVAGHPHEKRFTTMIDQMGASLKKPKAGDSMDIKFTSMQGEEIDLAAMKGKVVLVDFWATWCAPCKAEMPNVKETYDKFHARGFEVIGISLDSEKTEEKLKNYIKENGLTWPQAFDGQAWETPLAKKFGITGIPATFLIGKDGKVIATNLRGRSLPVAVNRALAQE